MGKPNKSDGKPLEKKPSSPPRKAVPDRESSNRRSNKYENANQVKFKEVGIANIAVGMVYKADGKGPAFLGNILSHIENSKEKMNKCKLIFFSKLRKPDGSNEVYELANKQGNKYPFDVAVFCTLDGEYMTAASANFTRELNDIAKTVCAEEWKYGVPVFVHKGNAKEILPVNHYILNDDCVVLIKKVYENCETKELFLKNEFKDDILTEVFGDAKIGMDVINCMDDDVYDNL